MAHEPGSEASELPIFELPLAIVPGELVPLHIFEERYKRMIGFCLDNDAPFGIVLRADVPETRRIGCTARVTRVLERFDDGRLDVVVTGEEPIVVLERVDHDEYPAGQVMTLADDEPEADEGVAEATRSAFAELVERISGEPPDPEDFDDDSAYGLAARIEMPAETKQRMLEMRSENDRLILLESAIEGLLEALTKSKQIAERAKLNGKVVVG